MADPALHLRDVIVRRGARVALDFPALTVDPGEIVAVLGPNGAGKSTLLLVAGLLLRPDAGEVALGGEVATRRTSARLRRTTALALQDPLLFDRSVLDNAASGLRFRGVGKRAAEARAHEELARFGVADLAARPARTLSGGEAQRVALARAFAVDPALVLLDEPFAALDAETRATLLPEVGARLRASGAACLLVTHHPDEAAFMAAGFGSDRALVMLNDFVIVGPVGDPAGIRGAASASDAFARIAAAQARFVSRGDESGTHRLEQSLWTAAGIDPDGGWYVESGTGMGETLAIADERAAYALADRGTLLAVGDRLALEALVEGDPTLLNPYSVITVDAARHPAVNTDGARALFDFLLLPETQATIGAFGVETFGEPLFIPCAANSCGRLPSPVATPVATPAA
jgi:tungstate transport system substrate-binding protein